MYILAHIAINVSVFFLLFVGPPYINTKLQNTDSLKLGIPYFIFFDQLAPKTKIGINYCLSHLTAQKHLF